VDTELVNFGVRAFVTLLAVVDPLGNVPFFITATETMPAPQRRGVALRACLASAGVLAAFAVGGWALLWAFHLTMPAVRIGGGVVLLVIALQMLSGRQFDWERDRPAIEPGRASRDTGVVPLGIPLMAGPGAMSSVLVLVSQPPHMTNVALVVAGVALVCAIGYACYLAALPLMRRLGRTAVVALSCLMGLVLAALAVQFMLDGLRQAMPRLFHRP
jgi:multiple antibiotic resistance protein